MKKICIWVGLVLLLLVLGSCGVASQPDYTAVPELGQQVDLVEGLSEEEREAAIRNYFNSDRSAYQELRIIAANCQMNIPEEYFGGCYFQDVMTDPKLYVLLTDLSAAPVIENDRVIFREVKYTEAELEKFQSAVWEYYLDKGIREAGRDTKSNRIQAGFEQGTDLSILYHVLNSIQFTFYYDQLNQNLNKQQISCRFDSLFVILENGMIDII